MTLRNGRYVVPVKAEAKGRVKGIVHDSSGSGQTLFIEPLVIVELGNAWREAQLAEQEEVERILDELSALVGANVGPLRETLDALARFDLWSAKAQLAGEMGAARAETSKRAGGRAPLGAPSRASPAASSRSTSASGDGFTALVVTGPNTGGKTVTLRTLGLLALMHQAGLHIPAAGGSRLPIFRDVFADIGDEQSIAQSLSTFSGHMRSIIRIVEAAGPGHARPARRARRRHGPDRGLRARPGAARPLHQGRRARRRDDALRRAEGLRPHDRGRDERLGRVRPRDAQPDVPPDDRPARRLAGVRDRGAARPARGARRRCAVAAVRVAADVRGDARPDPGGRGRDGRIQGARPRGRAASGRGAARGRRGTPARRSSRGRTRSELRGSRRERIVAELRTELEAARRSLERGQLTAPAMDAILERADDRLDEAARGVARRAGRREPAARRPRPRRAWRVGDQVRSASGGWTGRIAELDRSHKRATIEAGAMRVSVDVADLERARWPGVSRGHDGRRSRLVRRRRHERRGAPALAREVRPDVARRPRRARRRGARGAGLATSRTPRWRASSA